MGNPRHVTAEQIRHAARHLRRALARHLHKNNMQDISIEQYLYLVGEAYATIMRSLMHESLLNDEQKEEYTDIITEALRERLSQPVEPTP